MKVSGDQLVSASVLSADPPVFYVRPRPMPFGLAGYLAENSRGTPMTCIVRTMWTLEAGTAVETELAPIYRAFRARYPHIRLIVAANTWGELDLLSRHGIETVFANHNMFVNERMFRPMPEIERRYDAVYNANFSAFKRRELSAEIPSCVHIGYFSELTSRQNAEALYAAEKAKLPHHEFANPLEDGAVFRFPHGRVNRILAEAHVGLCLSEIEGPMVACMEYLLAGLPVVTTPNIGGRDRYLTPETSITAEANPRAIREAVEALKARAIPRRVVRQATLKLVERDRATFNAFIDSLREGHPPVETGDDRFTFRYMNNLYGWKKLSVLVEDLGFPQSFIGPPPDVLSLLAEGLARRDAGGAS